MIVVVGLSHKTAPLEVRERLAIARDLLPAVLAELTAERHIGEAVILSTCNRVEVYAAPRSKRASDGDLVETAKIVEAKLRAIAGDPIGPHLIRQTGATAVLHLFRVAASLDSLVIGEPQILGQLKDAIDLARETKTLSSALGNAMHRAVRVGKRVRTETQIGAGQVSVSSVAIDLAGQIFGELDRCTALLVGAGEMAEAAAKLLVRAGAKLIVVNRSLERAESLAHEVGGEARPWDRLEASLVDADIVISSTSSPTYVLTEPIVKSARKARKGRSMFLIDIAVPRDIDPIVNKLDNVYRYDVDDLSQIVSKSLEGRAAEAEKAHAIVVEEARGFEAWTLEQALTPAIVKLRQKTRSVLVAEVERSLGGKLKHLGQPEREALGAMIDAMTNKLLHAPSTKLKSLASDPRASDYVDALHTLFELPASDEAEAPAAEGGRTSAGAGEGRQAQEAPQPLAAKGGGAQA